ncbi:MAG: protein phosphatase 2C domain-containing protein [Acidobacteriota bacterium]
MTELRVEGHTGGFACVADDVPAVEATRGRCAGRKKGPAGKGRPFAGADRPDGLAVTQAFAREDGLYGVLYVQGPSAEAAAEGAAAVREEIDRLPAERSTASLRDALLAAHARLDALNAVQAAQEGKDRKKLLGMAGLMSRSERGFDIAYVGFIRALVVRRGRLLQPLAPPQERLGQDDKIVTELLGSARRPWVALAEATADGGDLFAITTKSIVSVPEPELLDLLGRAATEDVTGALVERVGAIVTIPVPGTPARPEVGRGDAVTWAALSSVGMRRANEDAYRVLSDAGIFACGDGLGGHEGGADASRIAVDTAVEVHAAEGPWVAAEDTAHRAFELASLRVAKATDHGGSTLDLVKIRDGKAILAHLGDSRVYLLRDGSLRQLTEDHSVVGERVRAGLLTREQARTHPERNVITRAVGLAAVAPDVMELKLRARDVLLLGTDGLTVPVGDGQIHEILRGSDCDLGGAVSRLIDAAYEGGAQDNVTAILIRIDGTGTRSRRKPVRVRAAGRS